MSDYSFQFKPFNEMTPEDYATVGFMSGLEVHQQLLTEKKLFCRCPAGKYSEKYNAEILRHMRPTLSELGEYDGTALMEFKTKKEIIYRINHDTVCTYEMDDTPPFQINENALDIAVEVGILLNSNLVDELHIARKQYLDGSIPTGFQRTAIVSVGGAIPYKDRQINIIQMSIEEDSCREISDVGHRRIYNTDRLGMPLIETVTAPDMRTPQEVAEVNNLLRRLSRSTGKVRTGIGAGREDVNVSVRGGTRIEIKGVSKITKIPLLTYNEAMRQWNLLRLREELHRRGITEDTFEAKTDDVTKYLTKTNYLPIYNAIAEGHVVQCVTLRKFKNLLRWQTQTDTFFSKEISDRVRVIACLTTLPNIIHSDSHENTLSSSEGQRIRKAVGATDEDTLVLVWGSEKDAEMGAKEIIIRAKEAAIGIPSETRQALPDGTNGFERILPGPDRMYPDTDLPPKQIPEERVNKIRAQAPTPFWKLENWYEELGLPKYLAQPLSTSKFAGAFEIAVKELKIEPRFVAEVLIQFPKILKKKELKRKGIRKNFKSQKKLLKELTINSLEPDISLGILRAFSEGAIIKHGIIYAMEKMAGAGAYKAELLPKPADDVEILEAITIARDIISGLKINREDRKEDILMSYAMAELRGRADGRKVRDMLNEKNTGANNGK